MKTNILLLALISGMALRAMAQVPSVISYQGRVQVNGTNFSGTGQFKFAIVSAGTNITRQATATATVTSGFVTSISVTDGGAGYTSAPAVTITDSTGSGASATANVSGGMVSSITVNNAGSGYSSSPSVAIAPPPLSFVYGTFWSNDGTSDAGSEPASSVAVPVQQGLFNVFLGDTTLSNMQPVPPSVFTQPDVRLRIWFSDGVNGFSQLSPDQRLGSVGYAMMAAQVSDSGVNASAIADNAITTAKLALDAVTTERIQDRTITAADLSTSLLEGTFWKLNGNSGTTAGADFLGTLDNQPLEVKVQGQRALRLEPTAKGPNIIEGFGLNYIRPPASGSTISGGGTADFFGRAYSNSITADFSTIGGGAGNTIEVGARFATISGGYNSTIREGSYDASIGNGGSNEIGTNCTHSRVCGGEFNTIGTGSDHAIVGGGYQNVIRGNAPGSTIGGGSNNSVDGSYGTVPGGVNNTAAGQYSFAAGSFAQANHRGAFVWADGTGVALASQRNDQFRVRATGGARFDVNSNNWVDIFTFSSGFGLGRVTKLIDTSTGAYLSAGGVWTDSSDRNLKENFESVDGRKILDRVAQLPITTWDYKVEGPSVRHIGPVAQDFQAAFGLSADDKHIAPLDANGVALAAIQELNKLLKEKDSKISALEKRLSNLETLISSNLAHHEN
jgi:hypothetical protein